jgi:queuine/archaeosine tRNA-ribosyltransferase
MVKDARRAIEEDRFPAFKKEFLAQYRSSDETA